LVGVLDSLRLKFFVAVWVRFCGLRNWSRSGITSTEQAESKRRTVDALVRTVSSHTTIVRGPDVPVGAKAATSLALALHESATNAVKYGALSEPNGVINIKWGMARKPQP
jgi:two-component sensor histidine kinase